jgi:hypothetical protein
MHSSVLRIIGEWRANFRGCAKTSMVSAPTIKKKRWFLVCKIKSLEISQA